ncbi:hypothetical protein ZIOFF_026133 [Zingiber officinale]|uniref:Reverse transcriptase zinc-binding domain-containing protein n=1 Tax=Zingiber officinale TaxID=94328 RepID=A0A8J5LF80_ZINOF|nr:hypothetical protein ZIOFF_026133 [Zingiber officinale]
MAASPTPALSPSSDERLWSRLNDSIDCILLDRNPDFHSSPSSRFRAESECGKRLREGSELLISGFDSVSSSLSQFSSTLITMRQMEDTCIPKSSKSLRNLVAKFACRRLSSLARATSAVASSAAQVTSDMCTCRLMTYCSSCLFCFTRAGIRLWTCICSVHSCPVKRSTPIGWDWEDSEGRQNMQKPPIRVSILLFVFVQQRASDLTKITVSEKQLRESRKTTSEEPKAKRLCGSDKLLNKREAISCNKSSDEISYANNNKVGDSCGFLDEKDDKISSNAIQTAALDKSKTLATSMVTKTSYLLCELKNMKLELWLMQERCNMLEEENIRLRESFDNGARLEDDDLIRLQLETLLAEKSRLANDNANLLRENQCLHQLIEYHKLISQDLSTSDEELDTHGMCLDFSSPQARSESGLEDEAHSDCKVRNSRDSNKRLRSEGDVFDEQDHTHDTYIWRWRVKHIDSPLLKWIAQIRDQIISSVGSIVTAQQTLASWFSQHSLSRCGINQAYDFFRNTRACAPWAGTIWKKHIQSNHRFTLWLLAHHRLPTRGRLEYLGDTEQVCVFFGITEEAQEHLFFGCLHTHQLWDRIRDWLCMTHEMTTYRRMLWIYVRRYRGTGILMHARHVVMTALIHYIWQARSRLRTMYCTSRLDAPLESACYILLSLGWNAWHETSNDLLLGAALGHGVVGMRLHGVASWQRATGMELHQHGGVRVTLVRVAFVVCGEVTSMRA